MPEPIIVNIISPFQFNAETGKIELCMPLTHARLVYLDADGDERLDDRLAALQSSISQLGGGAGGGSSLYYATIPASGWGTAPYVRTIAVEGLPESDKAFVAVVESPDASTAAAERREMNSINSVYVDDGEISVTCSRPPRIDLNIKILVVN